MQEIPIRFLLKTLTLHRLWNAVKSLAGMATSILTRRPVVWGQPFILTIEPTNVCNLKCPLCVTGNGRMTRENGFMRYETFKQIMDDVGEHLFYTLLYHQGEPFLNSKFLKFVRYAKGKNIFVTTSTNGHYLSTKTARETVESGLDSLIISIDGQSQATYAQYRVGGRLDKVKQGVRNLIDERKRQNCATPFVMLQFIVMQHNEHEINAMRDMTKSLGADKLLLKTVQVETEREAKTWLPRNQAFRRYRATSPKVKLPKKGTCQRPWTSALVNWDGRVAPCCFDKNAHHSSGTVGGNYPLEKIWLSDEYEQFRRQMLADRSAIDICSNCTQGLSRYL